MSARPNSGIRCRCGEATEVFDSRPVPETVRRRRQCKTCGERFTTIEIISDTPTRAKLPLGLLVKKGGINSAKGWIVGYWRTGKKMHGYVLNSYDDPGVLINVTHGSVSEWMEPYVNRLTWTPEMIEALVKARSENASYLDCSDIIGVDYKDIAKKCHELGIGGKRNNGKSSGRAEYERKKAHA